MAHSQTTRSRLETALELNRRLSRGHALVIVALPGGSQGEEAVEILEGWGDFELPETFEIATLAGDRFLVYTHPEPEGPSRLYVWKDAA